MVIPNPWYTGNNPIESYQIPRQNLLQNLRSELIRTNQGPEDNLLKNLLMELKLRWQIIGKLIKRLVEEKDLSNNGMEKQSNCKSEAPPTQGVNSIYLLLLFLFFFSFFLTFFLILCFKVGEELADYDTIQ